MSPVMDWRVLEAVRKKASNTSLRCLAMFMMIVKAVWRVATVAPFTNTKLGDRGLWNTHNKKQVCSGGFSASLGIYFRARLIVRVDPPSPNHSTLIYWFRRQFQMDEEYIKMNCGSNLKSQARLAWGRWRIEYSVWGRKFPYLSFIMIHSYLESQKYENVGEIYSGICPGWIFSLRNFTFFYFESKFDIWLWPILACQRCFQLVAQANHVCWIWKK